MTCVTAEVERCIGAGRCQSVAPELFDQTDHGEVVVLRAPLDKEEVALALEAAELCPGRALSVSED
ncbi:ferredoxin [Streptomyces sp. NPDC007983]|uniref:ferredoxin n=1 Tax=Streptomyces sp. NPDC007983 TaxID=3364800 RepID=UPI0036F14CB3